MILDNCGRRSSSVLILLHVWIQRFSKLSLIICISSIPLAMRSFSNCINVFVSFNDSIILLVLATFSGTLSDILTSSASSTALNPLSRSISLDLFLLNSSTFLYSNLVIEAYSLWTASYSVRLAVIPCASSGRNSSGTCMPASDTILSRSFLHTRISFNESDICLRVFSWTLVLSSNFLISTLCCVMNSSGSSHGNSLKLP